MARRSQGWFRTLLFWSLASPALAQVPAGDPSAPPSPTLAPTTTQAPSPTAAAHTRSEVLAYLIAIDEVGVALGRIGRDRRADPQVRALAADLFRVHQADISRVRALGTETGIAPVVTSDVRTREGLGGTDLDALNRAADIGFDARFLDAVAEFHRDAVDLIDKRLVSDAGDDKRVLDHLQATRSWISDLMARAQALRSQGK